LTRSIALSKIGNSVVDEKAIELLSKKITASSGDAHRFLEILSRSIMWVLDGMSEEILKSHHAKTLIGPPYIMIKRNDLVEGSPTKEKAVICLCIRLAPIIRSRSIPLSTLLEVCRGGYDALELETESELKSILERLLASELLKLLDRRIPASPFV
jgi:Cdc6-like AAA superfamily ATPase